MTLGVSKIFLFGTLSHHIIMMHMYEYSIHFKVCELNNNKSNINEHSTSRLIMFCILRDNSAYI